MSAAVLFFWDWAGAPPPPPPPPPPPAPAPDDPGAGSGKGKGKGKGKGRPEYIPRTDEYWDERERYLRTLYPEEIPPAPPPDDLATNYEREANRLYEERKQQLEALTAERAAAISDLRNSADAKSMLAAGARITTLNAKIADLMGKQAVSRFMQ